MEGKNRACVLTALKTMEFRDVPMPKPAKGEILMKWMPWASVDRMCTIIAMAVSATLW